MSTVMEKTVSLSAHGNSQKNQSNSVTQTVYSLIRDGKYGDAIRSLHSQLQTHPTSRAALSLLAYCYYYLQDFASAAEQYELLVKHYPEVVDYQINLAQCLFKAGQYEEAHKAAAAVTAPEHAERMTQLQASIRYVQDDLPGTQAFLAQADATSADTIVAMAGVQFKEGKYEEALASYESAISMIGQGVDMMYNMAVCRYRLGQHAPAMQLCNEIIEKGVREHPELSVGSNIEGADVRSVGNTMVLRTTCLLEAFNLKMAIEYTTKNLEGAAEALKDMPPRSEEELDPVTLHNTALCDMATDPPAGFRKLQHLLRNPPHPPETLGNLVLLYVRHQLLDLAADALADYEDLHDAGRSSSRTRATPKTRTPSARHSPPTTLPWTSTSRC
jgi:tetratricopeptide repeat protein 30